MKKSELKKLVKEVLSESKGDFDKSLKLASKMSSDAKKLSVLYGKVASGLGNVTSADKKQRKGVVDVMFKAKNIIGSLEKDHHTVFMDIDLPADQKGW